MKKNKIRRVGYFLAVAAVLTIAIAVYAQQKTDKDETCPMMAKMAVKDKMPEDCPMMKKNASLNSETKTDDQSDHLAMVMKNGEMEMGFSQTATTHHFLLMKDGGAIEVGVNDIKGHGKPRSYKKTFNRDRRSVQERDFYDTLCRPRKNAVGRARNG